MQLDEAPDDHEIPNDPPTHTATKPETRRGALQKTTSVPLAINARAAKPLICSSETLAADELRQ